MTRLCSSVCVSAAVLFSCSLTPVSAFASIRILSDPQLAEASAAAIHGRVVSAESRWDPAVEAIYTYVTVDVWRAWGPVTLPRRVVLKQLGGRVGAAELSIGGQAHFAADEEVFVFVDIRPRDSTLYVAGFEQGKWAISRFTRLGAPAAERAPHVPVFQPSGPAERRPLADLEVMAAATGGGAKPLLVPVPPELSQSRPAAPAWTHLIPEAPARWH